MIGTVHAGTVRLSCAENLGDVGTFLVYNCCNFYQALLQTGRENKIMVDMADHLHEGWCQMGGWVFCVEERLMNAVMAMCDVHECTDGRFCLYGLL